MPPTTSHRRYHESRITPGGIDPNTKGLVTMNTVTDPKPETMTHTPGPWRACGSVYQDTGKPFDRSHTDTRIAIMDRDEPKTSPCERDLNAHLIAAAPELLTALGTCAAELRMIHAHYHPNCKGGCPCDAAQYLATAAIAKATQSPILEGAER